MHHLYENERGMIMLFNMIAFDMIACERGEGKERGRGKGACRNGQGFQFPNAANLCHVQDRSNNITTKLYDKRDMASTLLTFPSCQAIFHQHQPMVSMHLSSFAMPVVAQVILIF